MIKIEKYEKIAFFLPALNGGGAERAILDIASGLALRGRDVDLVLSNAQGIYLKDVPNSVRLIDLRNSRTIYSVWSLSKYIRNNKPLSITSTLEHSNVVTILAKLISGTKTKVYLREANTTSISTKKFRALKILVSLFYRFSSGIIAVSEGVSEDIQKTVKTDSKKINVIPNPIDIDQIREYSREKVDHPWFSERGEPVLIAVGRLAEQKDYFTLIKAFSILKSHSDAKLIILGEGPDRAVLSDLIKDLNLSASIEMLGFEKNPFKYIARSRALVMSSIYEGMPNVILQAIALNKPVVSTNCKSGPSEIITPEIGYLVDVGDTEQLAERMRSILLFPTVNDCTSSKILEKYNPSLVLQKYDDILTR